MTHDSETVPARRAALAAWEKPTLRVLAVEDSAAGKSFHPTESATGPGTGPS